MVAIYTVWYNFMKMPKTLRMTPAMAAGVSQTLWSMDGSVRHNGRHCAEAAWTVREEGTGLKN